MQRKKRWFIWNESRNMYLTAVFIATCTITLLRVLILQRKSTHILQIFKVPSFLIHRFPNIYLIALCLPVSHMVI